MLLGCQIFRETLLRKKIDDLETILFFNGNYLQLFFILPKCINFHNFECQLHRKHSFYWNHWTQKNERKWNWGVNVHYQNCSQFHQHFTSSFFANILSSKITKPNWQWKKDFKNTFTQKTALKLLVKLTPCGCPSQAELICAN